MSDLIIKVDDNYEIVIDGNKNHEAREDLHKVYINPTTGQEIPKYRTVGNYSNVPNSLDAISKDMAIQEASKKEIVTVNEYTKIIRESNEYMMDIIRDKFPELL